MVFIFSMFPLLFTILVSPLTHLPVAVPPVTNALSSYSIPSHIKEAAEIEIVFWLIMSVIVMGFVANFLNVIVFPFIEMGFNVAFTLSPVSNCASNNGVSNEMLLPTLLPINDE